MNKFLKTVWDFKVVIIQFITVVAILTILPIACQDKKGTSAMLKEHGYEIVSVGGYAWYNCPAHITFWHTKFVVKDKKTGKNLNGCYCTGFVKRVVIQEDGF